MRFIILSSFFVMALSTCTLAGESKALPLWEKGAEGSQARMSEPEKVDQSGGGFNVTNVHNPSITPFLPDSKTNTGTAVIIAPGGGHRMLCLGHEGDALAQWFADHGIAAFVLRYRLAREEGSHYTVDEHAMADTRRAIRMVRARASSWNIKPDRIGILGFSAGGELAALAAMDSDSGNPDADDVIDRQSSRPDYQVLIYPGSSKRFTAKAGMPPVFIAFGEDDRADISEGMANVYLKYKAAKVPAEMHIYSGVGHGFGYRPNTKTAAGAWPQRMREWLVARNLLSEPTGQPAN
jgi:endo-1,4-beta-xylanase